MLVNFPPPEFWLETILGPVASNRWILIVQSFPLPESFDLERDWIDPRDVCCHQLEKINSLLLEDFHSKPLHPGWFRPSFQIFKTMPGLEIKGETSDSHGFMVLDGAFAGILMPCYPPVKNAFKFNDLQSDKFECSRCGTTESQLTPDIPTIDASPCAQCLECGWRKPTHD